MVAIPVRNEAERIAACLQALDMQLGIDPASLGIVLFLNNCTDATADIVASTLPSLRFATRMLIEDDPAANAGWARRKAMQAAATWLDEAGAEDGVILTTDADSRVAHDWLRRNLDEIDAGADAVAGRICLDDEEAARLPEQLHARGRLEAAYGVLLSEIAARLDPRPHDPWPCHATVTGASIAVRLVSHERVGGMPSLALGEDRAFIAMLEMNDARVRHAPNIEVVTSGRLEGRAPGGAADTMRLRCEQPDSSCDAQLEPLSRAVLRHLCRHRLRRLLQQGKHHRIVRWAPLLAITRAEAAAAASLPNSGRVLAAIEGTSPRLRPRPLKPHQLRRHIFGAKLLLGLLQASDRMRHLAIGPFRRPRSVHPAES